MHMWAARKVFKHSKCQHHGPVFGAPTLCHAPQSLLSIGDACYQERLARPF